MSICIFCYYVNILNVQDVVKADAGHVGVEEYIASLSFSSWASFRPQYMVGSGNNKDCEEWFFDRKFFHTMFISVFMVENVCNVNVLPTPPSWPPRHSHTFIHACMYVCTYMGMHACMYVCIHVCLCECMNHRERKGGRGGEVCKSERCSSNARLFCLQASSATDLFLSHLQECK